jgi:hypothetical protein
MSDEELRKMSRLELDQLLSQVMYRLRQIDSQDLKREILTRSQKLSLGLATAN